MVDRITELRAQAEEEIAAARTLASLEEARVKHLGRKAELPNLLPAVPRRLGTNAGRALSVLPDILLR